MVCITDTILRIYKLQTNIIIAILKIENVSTILSRNQMFFKASSPDGAWSWDTFISPFSKKMWIVAIANILLSALVLYTTHYFRASKTQKYRNRNAKEEKQFNMTNSFFTAFSAQVQQGKLLKN